MGEKIIFGIGHIFKFILIMYFCSSVLKAKSDEWTDIYLDVSYFEDDPYPIPNLFDGDIRTYAVNGTVFFELPGQENITVNIFPGNGGSKEEFLKYSRPKEIRFSVLAGVHADGFVTEIATVYKGLPLGEPKLFSLSDTFEVQSFEIGLPQHELKKYLQRTENKFRREFQSDVKKSCVALKIEVTDAYAGSESADICISEIFTGDVLASDTNSGGIKRVFLNEAENRLMIEKEDGTEKEIYSDPSSVLQTIEASQNKNWATVISMPSEIEGRAEAEYLLFDLSRSEVMNEKIGASSAGAMYFGEKWAGLETLVYTANDGSERKVYLK
jgi:hypothetical protein